MDVILVFCLMIRNHIVFIFFFCRVASMTATDISVLMGASQPMVHFHLIYCLFVYTFVLTYVANGLNKEFLNPES